MPDTERFLEGKHAIVTGGSRGIGAAVAKELVSRGAKVTIMGRHPDALEQKAAEMRGEPGVTVAAEECDVGDSASVSAAFSRAMGISALHTSWSTTREQRRAECSRS